VNPTRDSLISPLAERDGERQRLLTLFTAADAPPTAPSAVVLVGDAGVGKSRLMNDCVPAIEALGYHPLPVVATPALRDVPFGAFR